MNTQKKGMTGKDIITVGIFSAIYFVINFAFMLLSGLHPLLWILMPGLIAVFAGIPFLMMCTKVPKTGAVVLMGFISCAVHIGRARSILHTQILRPDQILPGNRRSRQTYQ